jgi:hypothetical protein
VKKVKRTVNWGNGLRTMERDELICEVQESKRELESEITYK